MLLPRLIDVFWISLAAVTSFEFALATDYLLLKLLLRAMARGQAVRQE